MYTQLLDKDEYLDLSPASRALLHDIWLAVARAGNGEVSADQRALRRRLGVRKVDLEPLIQGGWIEVLSSPSLEQSRAEAEKNLKPASEVLGEPKVDDANASTWFDWEVESLLTACGEPLEGTARRKLLALTMPPVLASQAMFVSARERIRTKTTPYKKSKIAYAIGIIQDEAGAAA